MIEIVVATDKNGAIGIENKIPWRIRSDLVRLAQMTRKHTVIVGRKSYESMAWYYDTRGTKMPGGHYLVLTRDETYKTGHDNAQAVHSIDEALRVAKALGDPHIVVIGGGTVFTAALPFTDKIHLTEVQTELTGDIDAYFKISDPQNWHEVSREHFEKNERDDFDTEHIILERTAK